MVNVKNIKLLIIVYKYFTFFLMLFNQSSEDEAAVLWLDEIQETVDNTNKKASNANKCKLQMLTFSTVYWE